MARECLDDRGEPAPHSAQEYSMRSTRASTLRTAAILAALLAAAPTTSFAAGNSYSEAQEQRDVAALHRDSTVQPRPPEEAIVPQATQPGPAGQTSSAVDCADPANASMSVCSTPK
jgi:hypothetical protein